MTGMKKPNEKLLMLFSGRAYPALADEIAALMGVELVPTRALNYANSEIYVRFEESVRGSDAFVIQSHAAPVNEWIMEQLIMVDALKRASAKRITVVAPFYPYARQDKKHRGREPISARLVADLFRTAGANRLMSVDLHAAQIQGFFDGPVDHLWALPVLADYLQSKYDTSEMTVVSPDAGRVRLADMWTDRLNGRLAIIHKRRDPDVANEVAVHEVVGDVEGRVCLLVDDMIDTAGTICQAAEALMARGAKGVIAAATHAVLSGPAVERLQASAIEEVVVTNTLPIPAGTAVPEPDRPLHRPLDRPRHHRGLRGRLGDQFVQRAVLIAAAVVRPETTNRSQTAWIRVRRGGSATDSSILSGCLPARRRSIPTCGSTPTTTRARPTRSWSVSGTRCWSYLRVYRLTLRMKCDGLTARTTGDPVGPAVDHVAAGAGPPPGPGRAGLVPEAGGRRGRTPDPLVAARTGTSTSTARSATRRR